MTPEHALQVASGYLRDHSEYGLEGFLLRFEGESDNHGVVVYAEHQDDRVTLGLGGGKSVSLEIDPLTEAVTVYHYQ